MGCLLVQLKGCSLGRAMQTFVHLEVVEVGQVAQGNVSAAVAFSTVGFPRLGTTAFCICVPKGTMYNNCQAGVHRPSSQQS